MDDLIDTFFQCKYTQEARDTMYASLGLFTVFNYPEPYGDISDLICMEREIENDTIVEGVRGYIDKGIDHLLRANNIYVLDEVPLRDKNRILENIFLISKIEDPEPYMSLFCGYLSNEEIMSRVFGILREDDYTEYMTQLKWVYDGTITKLKNYLTEMQTDNESADTKTMREIRKNLYAYFSAFGEVAIALSIQELNMLKGQKFDLYLELLKDEVVIPENLEDTVYALLFMALMSEDGHTNPMLLLLDKIKNLLPTQGHINSFNTMLTRGMAAYTSEREKL